MDKRNTTPEQTQRRVQAERKTKRNIAKESKKLNKLKIQYLGVNEIAPNNYNPNRQDPKDFELLLRSIEDDGFTQPVIVTKENLIVDGEHRWRAAKVLGMKKIPVVQVDMEAEQARISTIRHNRARGVHDVELEVEILKELQLLGAGDFMKDALMISQNELDKLIDDVPAPEALASEEFTEAWEPSRDKVNELQANQKTTVESNGGLMDVSASERAIERMRENEKKLEMANTAEERSQIRKDDQLYRLNLIYEGNDGNIVRDTLGESPSEKVIELCKKYG